MSLPEEVKYRLQSTARCSKGPAILLGIFLSPFAYLYVKDTNSVGAWGWFALNLFTANYLFLGILIVPIHAATTIDSARRRLERNDIRW